jgi:hypothetical protein
VRRQACAPRSSSPTARRCEVLLRGWGVRVRRDCAACTLPRSF